MGSTHASNSFENEIASQLAAVALILRPKPVKAKRHLRFHKNFTKAQELEARVGSKSWGASFGGNIINIKPSTLNSPYLVTLETLVA